MARNGYKRGIKRGRSRARSRAGKRSKVGRKAVTKAVKSYVRKAIARHDDLDVTPWNRHIINSDVPLSVTSGQASYTVSPFLQSSTLKSMADLMLYRHDDGSFAAETGLLTVNGTVKNKAFVQVKGIAQLHLKNNYLTPVECIVYVYKCIASDAGDIDTELTEYFDNLAQSDAQLETHPMMYPPRVINKKWRCVSKVSNLFMTGDERKYNFKFSGRVSNEYYVNNPSPTYVENNSYVFLVRMRGGVMHETGTDSTISYGPGQLDGILNRWIRYRVGRVHTLSKDLAAGTAMTAVTTAPKGFQPGGIHLDSNDLDDTAIVDVDTTPDV